MTDPDEQLKRRYRELASEAPSSVIDAAILAQARARAGARRSGISRWAGPVSIAAVLVLGIGVSLRMQLEQPGIETAAPERSSMSSVPSAPAPAPADVPASKDEARARDQFAASPPESSNAPAETMLAQKRAAPPPTKPKVAVPEVKERLAATAPEANVAPRAAPSTTTSAMSAAPPPAPAPVQAPAKVSPSAPLGRIAADERRAENAQAPPAAPAAAPAFAPAPRRYEPPQAASRAKQEAQSDRAAAGVSALADSGAGARELRKSVAAETDPARELERIAKLREAGQHADAEKALTEFRKRFPDYRIPDAVWERVRPR